LFEASTKPTDETDNGRPPIPQPPASGAAVFKEAAPSADADFNA